MDFTRPVLSFQSVEYATPVSFASRYNEISLVKKESKVTLIWQSKVLVKDGGQYPLGLLKSGLKSLIASSSILAKSLRFEISSQAILTSGKSFKSLSFIWLDHRLRKFEDAPIYRFSLSAVTKYKPETTGNKFRVWIVKNGNE